MNKNNIYILVQKAKQGDKESMKTLLEMFNPLIIKVSKKAGANDRNDLKQHITESIIKAIYKYDLRLDKDFNTTINLIINTYKNNRN